MAESPIFEVPMVIEKNGVSEVRSNQLTKILESLLTVKNVTHAIMAVESGDRSFSWTGAIGTANPDGTPMQIDTPFMIASITKLYIAAAILRLQEQEKINIWKPAAEYLPDKLIHDLHVMNGIDYSPKITVYNLLSHTSGLPDYIEERQKDGTTLIAKIAGEGDFSFSIEDCIHIVRHSLSPHFPPQDPEKNGIKARYSDTNFRLLLEINERVTTRNQQRLFEELFFKPLGLKQTYVPGEASLEPVRNHSTLWFSEHPIEIPLVLRSVGDLYSTIGDLLKFIRALIKGDVFDDPATSDLMQGRWNHFGFSLNPARLRSPGWPIEYGIGMMRYHLPPIFTGFKPVPAVIGHTGSTGTWLFYCPDRDLYLAGAVDQVTAGAVPYRIVPRILGTVQP